MSVVIAFLGVFEGRGPVSIQEQEMCLKAINFSHDYAKRRL